MTEPAIPFVDLGAQHAPLREAIRDALTGVLDRGDFILGPAVARFEQAFAGYCEAEHAVGCANGTDAITLACMGLGIGPGDEVIVPAMTFAATAFGVMGAGARPVLVDVTADACLLDPARIEAAITPRTKAIIPVHLYGTVADMDAISSIAEAHGLRIIEDAAQAHGAYGPSSRGPRRAGSFGHAACFSFYPSKNLGCLGDGGAVVTSDDALAEKLRALRNVGAAVKYRHDVRGPNSRLDTLQAAVLELKLPHLDRWNEQRRALARAYDAALTGLPDVEITRTEPGSVHHLYVVRHPSRDEALRSLQAAGVGAGLHYPGALHQQAPIAALGYAEGDFPVAEDWARRCLSLAMYAEMPEAAVARAARVLAAV